MNLRDEMREEMSQWTDYMKRKSQTNHDKAVKHFKEIGEFEDGMVLHHIDFTMFYFDPDRYVEWNPEDLKPMSQTQHLRLHNDFARRSRLGLFDDVWKYRIKNLTWG